jgi:hypothetical protein
MSANQYICAVPIFQGNQGKYYIVDGYKYDIHFPLAWALDHHNHKPYYSEKKNKTYINGSGPKKCGNCSLYGSIHYVFIGYCSNCLRDVYHDKRGDHSVAPGMSIGMLSECTLWQQYPYLNGIKISEIGDKIAEEETEEEHEESEEERQELDEDEDFNKYKEEFEENFKKMCEEDEEERYSEERYEIQLEKFKDTCCRYD